MTDRVELHPKVLVWYCLKDRESNEPEFTTNSTISADGYAAARHNVQVGVEHCLEWENE